MVPKLSVVIATGEKKSAAMYFDTTPEDLLYLYMLEDRNQMLPDASWQMYLMSFSSNRPSESMLPVSIL